MFELQCQLPSTRREGRMLSIVRSTEASLRERVRQIVSFPGRDQQTMVIPFQVLGLEKEAGVQLRLLGLEISGPNGERWRADLGRPRRHTPPQAWVSMEDRDRGWLSLILDRSLIERFKGTKADVTGTLATIVYRE